MAEVRVIVNVGGDDHELTKEDVLFRKEIAAPNETEDLLVTAIDESGNETYRTALLEVLPEWLPPKTDWTAEDYFNAIDYNRIIGNIDYLKTLAERLFLNIEHSAKKEEKNYKSLIYAREINDIEKDVDALNTSTYLLDIGEAKTYKVNGRVPDYNEYNRVESACFRLYNELTCHKNNLPRMAFKLGNNMRFGGF